MQHGLKQKHIWLLLCLNTGSISYEFYDGSKWAILAKDGNTCVEHTQEDTHKLYKNMSSTAYKEQSWIRYMLLWSKSNNSHTLI